MLYVYRVYDQIIYLFIDKVDLWMLQRVYC